MSKTYDVMLYFKRDSMSNQYFYMYIYLTEILVLHVYKNKSHY